MGRNISGILSSKITLDMVKSFLIRSKYKNVRLDTLGLTSFYIHFEDNEDSRSLVFSKRILDKSDYDCGFYTIGGKHHSENFIHLSLSDWGNSRSIINSIVTEFGGGILYDEEDFDYTWVNEEKYHNPTAQTLESDLSEILDKETKEKVYKILIHHGLLY